MKMLKMRFESDQGKTIIAHSLICHSDAHSLRPKKRLGKEQEEKGMTIQK